MHRLAVVVLVEFVLAAVLVILLLGSNAAEAVGLPAVARGSALAAGARADADPRAAVGGTAPVPGRREEAGTRVTMPSSFRADDPVGVLLEGTVRARDGAVVVGPGVSARQDRMVRVAGTAQDGSYALAGLMPGTWTIHVRAEGFAPVELQHELSSEAFQRLDIALDATYPVKVRIETAAGEPGLPDVRQRFPAAQSPLHVVADKGRLPERLAATDYGVCMVGSATFRAERDPKSPFSGTLVLSAPPPAWAALLLRHVVVDQQRIEPGQQEVRFVVDPEAIGKLAATVTVRVVDADSGGSVVGVRVGIGRAFAYGPPNVDAEGRVEVRDLPPGLLHVSVYSKDYERPHFLIRVEPGQRLDLGELRLGKARPLTGRVLDADGKPAHASVQWCELKWRTQPREFRHSHSTLPDAEGVFSLPGSGTGLIALSATAPDGRIASGVFANPPAAPIELRLGPAAQLVVTRSADPSQAYTLTVFDDQRRAVDAWLLESRSTRRSLSLPPGEYGYEVHDDRDQLVRSGSLRLGTRPVTLELP